MINSCICTFNSMPLYIHAIRLLCEINTVNLHTTQTYEILNWSPLIFRFFSINILQKDRPLTTWMLQAISFIILQKWQIRCITSLFNGQLKPTSGCGSFLAVLKTLRWTVLCSMVGFLSVCLIPHSNSQFYIIC